VLTKPHSPARYLILNVKLNKTGALLPLDSVDEYGYEFGLLSVPSSEWTKVIFLEEGVTEFKVDIKFLKFTSSKDYIIRPYAILKDGVRLSSLYEYNSTDDPNTVPDLEDKDINLASSYDGFSMNFAGSFIQVDDLGKYVPLQEGAFLFDTNNEELAFSTWDEVIVGSPLAYSSSDLITAFSTIADSEKLTYGSSFTMVFTSKYGYGSEGKLGEYSESGVISTTIQPYTPLVFNVQILDKKILVVEDKE